MDLIIHGPGEGSKVALAGDLYRVLADGTGTGGRLFVCHATIPPGGGPPPHIHHSENEAFYVLRGELTFYVVDENLAVKGQAGAFVHLPQGRPHRFANETSETAEALIWTTPSGFGDMLMAAGTPSEVALPPDPQEIDRLLQLAPSFGIEMLPPG